MPGPMSHYIFYEELKKKIKERGIEVSSRYDSYSNFAQGHDLLMFQNYIKLMSSNNLEQCILMSKRLQEYSFVEFVYKYLKNAEDMGLLQDEVVTYFLCHGYIAHHILDAFTHPLIIFFCGDHVRTKDMKKWNHGIAENLIDAYLTQKVFKRKAFSYPVHKLFIFDKKIFTKELKKLIDITIKDVYGVEMASNWFYEGCCMMYTYMRHLKYDPTGIRRILLDGLEHFVHGANGYSYHRNLSEVKCFINEEHELWNNPMFPEITSTDSFMDLFDKALAFATNLIIKLQQLMKEGNITKEKIEDIIPDIASTHGQKCGQELVIRTKKTAFCEEIS